MAPATPPPAAVAVPRTSDRGPTGTVDLSATAATAASVSYTHLDFFEFLTDLLDEWSGDDTDELIELLDTQLGDIGVDLKFEKRGTVEPEGEEEAEDEATDYEEEEFDEDDEGDEDEEEEEEGEEEGP